MDLLENVMFIRMNGQAAQRMQTHPQCAAAAGVLA